jgi:hypothetical protein
MFFFADNSELVRDLAVRAVKILMSFLSGYSVKLVLPKLLKGMEDSSWRSKYNHIWALGNMAFCSPKQLSQCLPQIVPKLTAALQDTHPKIRECANDALKMIGSSVKNPEISENVDILIKSLADPYDNNERGLEILLKTQFVHYIDAPSLALVIPLVDYALLQKKNTMLKQNACQVVGSISALIKKQGDILPYMKILINGIRTALGDSSTEVRLYASKAAGKIAEKIGQESTNNYFRFIHEILESAAATSIERSGAA